MVLVLKTLLLPLLISLDDEKLPSADNGLALVPLSSVIGLKYNVVAGVVATGASDADDDDDDEEDDALEVAEPESPRLASPPELVLVDPTPLRDTSPDPELDARTADSADNDVDPDELEGESLDPTDDPDDDVS